MAAKNETKWTPGPWERQASGPWLKGGNGEEVISTSGALRSDVNLIVAAPDLYEALRQCAAVLCGDEMSKQKLIDALTAAGAALAKARGEEP